MIALRFEEDIMRQSKAVFKKIFMGMTVLAVMLSNHLTAHASGFVEIIEEEIPKALTTNNGCSVHWIIIGMIALYAIYEVLHIIFRRKELICKKDFIPAGIYVVAIMLVLAFGVCEADIFVAAGGLLVGLTGVVCTIARAKKAEAKTTQTESI